MNKTRKSVVCLTRNRFKSKKKLYAIILMIMIMIMIVGDMSTMSFQVPNEWTYEITAMK